MPDLSFAAQREFFHTEALYVYSRAFFKGHLRTPLIRRFAGRYKSITVPLKSCQVGVAQTVNGLSFIRIKHLPAGHTDRTVKIVEMFRLFLRQGDQTDFFAILFHDRDHAVRTACRRGQLEPASHVLSSAACRLNSVHPAGFQIITPLYAVHSKEKPGILFMADQLDRSALQHDPVQIQTERKEKAGAGRHLHPVFRKQERLLLKRNLKTHIFMGCQHIQPLVVIHKHIAALAVHPHTVSQRGGIITVCDRILRKIRIHTGQHRAEVR